MSKRILIADDEPVTLELLTMYLESWDYEVQAVVDGEEALRHLAGTDPPRIAIIDWCMPGFTGPEVCRKLRLMEKHYTYVLLLTGQERDRLVQGLEAGADDFMSKPVDPSELKARLKVGERVLTVRRESLDAKFLQQVLHSLSSRVLLLDETGKVIAENRGPDVYSCPVLSRRIGANYLQACQEHKDYRMLGKGIRSVLDGTRENYCQASLRPAGYAKRWFDVSVTPLLGENRKGVVVSHEDTTVRVESERQQRILADALSEVSTSLSRGLSMSAVLARSLKGLSKVIEFDGAAAWKADNGTLTRLTFAGPELFREECDWAEHPGLKVAVSSRKGLAKSFLREDSRWTESALEILPREFDLAQSWLGVPIFLRGSLEAVFTMVSSQSGCYTESDVQVVEAFASQASVALDNVRLLGEIEALASLDDLTKLPNRRHFFELAESEMQRVRRYGNPVSVLMIDIDHFKSFNDTHGHAIGDAVLTEVARRLKKALRTTDILGRYGGEEFVAVLVETDLEAAPIVAERLRRSIANEPLETQKGPLQITISLGLAGHGKDLKEMLHEADAALYRAKAAGRNRFEGPLAVTKVVPDADRRHRLRVLSGRDDETNISSIQISSPRTG